MMTFPELQKYGEQIEQVIESGESWNGSRTI
jgi:hypothetical protein